ncbi:MAG: response regulator [Lachnospiraceae bacterium]|nr:response regulator [Lachnospiraceae bacterium]
MTDWIVIVDDDSTSLKTAGYILSKHNKRVTAMKSGQSLLEYVRENIPDLVLLDVNMPDMDGFETYEKLKDLEKEMRIAEIPVIFLTGDEDASIEQRGREMGAADFIKKPFDPDNLVGRIENVLKQRDKGITPLQAQPHFEPIAETNMKTISKFLEEGASPDSALQLERDSFIDVYRFVMRYVNRYHKKACKLLFTLDAIGPQDEEEYQQSVRVFCKCVKEYLRKSDLVMRYGKTQVFVLLTDIKEDAIAQVVGNMMQIWNTENPERLSVTYEVDFLKADVNAAQEQSDQPWICVVDDDVANLKLAGHVLSKNNMRVTALRSGGALLDLLKDHRPNLILLDVRMPGMDGFETKSRLMAMEEDVADIPVVFLTANDDIESEKKGLALGAIDFIRKPFVPEVLVMRVRRILDMVRLQRNLADEVEKKTKENQSLFIHVVQSLADAIDAKDSYTNGHSGRVAEYAREIAKRAGFNHREQSDIYMMGLLHDVGKIGVPDEVINKPGRLTDEEFEKIKKHPVIGSQILQNIEEMPSLATGARWHHERFDGTGYPDGLKGEEIPEAARIIAVADAYDAMTSYRSYRGVIPQEDVRREIERCSGTQFDPQFAQVMIKMIDEDAEFKMKEVRDSE